VLIAGSGIANAEAVKTPVLEDEHEMVVLCYEGPPEFLGKIVRSRKNWTNPRLAGQVEYLSNYDSSIESRLVKRLVLTVEDGLLMLPCKSCNHGRVAIGVFKEKKKIGGRVMSILRELGEHTAIGIAAHVLLAACCGI